MIHSKPKATALSGVAIFLAVILTVSIWLFVGLIRHPEDYLVAKLILAPTLLVIGLIVGGKTYAGAVRIAFGTNKIVYKYPFAKEKSLKLSRVLSWTEEKVKRQSTTYRRTSITFEDGKKIHLSNQENTNYEKVVKYLKQKRIAER